MGRLLIITIIASYGMYIHTYLCTIATDNNVETIHCITCNSFSTMPYDHKT